MYGASGGLSGVFIFVCIGIYIRVCSVCVWMCEWGAGGYRYMYVVCVCVWYVWMCVCVVCVDM